MRVIRRAVVPSMLAAFWCLPAIASDPVPTLASVLNPDNQLNSARDANQRNRLGGNQARNAGRNSIGKGGRNMSHGKHHHNASQVSMGAFQIAQGLLGLMASAKADQLANQDSTIATGLGEITSGGPDSSVAGAAGQSASSAGDVSGASSQGLGSASTGTSSIKINAEDLASAEVKQALAQVQEQYGYTPRQFLESLAAGNDPTALFTHAPQNALSPAEALQASRAAGAPSLSEEVAGQPSLPNSLAPAVVAEGDSANAVQGGNADAIRAAMRAALARRLASGEGGGEDDLEVSPEVKEALEARAKEESDRLKRESAASQSQEFDLFQVVHLKYQDREKSLTSR